MKIKALIAAMIVLVLYACSENKQVINPLTVRHAHLADLPSASGVEYTNKQIYIVGDDIRWLLTLNNNWEITDSLALSSVDTLVNNRTPGSIKADFESIAHFTYQNNNYLMVLSSGSKQVARDTAYLIHLGHHSSITKKNIRALYEKIKQTARIPAENEINIEGLAISNDMAYLLHRGNVSGNFLATIELAPLMAYLTSKDGSLPEFKVDTFNLPQYDNVASGFSGACLLPDKKGLLFTASLEDTGSELADGTILGSYIGFIPFSGTDKGTVYTALLVNKNKKPAHVKLESIAVTSVSGNKITALSVSDNDNGSSDIFELEIILNYPD